MKSLTWSISFILLLTALTFLTGCPSNTARLPSDAEKKDIETEAKEVYKIPGKPAKEVTNVEFLDEDQLGEYGLPQATLETLEITLERAKEQHDQVAVVEITREDGEKFYSVWHRGSGDEWVPP